MIVRRAEMGTFETDSCHDGQGRLIGFEAFADYAKQESGFKYLHDDELAPGASIGEHRHEGDEEIYFVLEGHGQMIVDGERYPIGPGDVCITRSGHSHGILNSPDGPMRLLVVCANV
ncbi:MAG: cupin domain-containing protein [Armatimonadetes bacterium]|jgi:mannose-6-phosphate isomerase-like protein (cupin superfamily)|nr:cupin domain-containing protein [Armatimonadota bacterium]